VEFIPKTNILGIRTLKITRKSIEAKVDHNMAKIIKDSFTFDDVLIEPGYSTIRTRSLVDLSTKIGHIKLQIPIIAANMDTVCEYSMAKFMNDNDTFGVIHRNVLLKDRFACVQSLYRSAVAFGVNEDLDTVISEANKYRTAILVLDIAHGDSEHAHNALKYVVQGLDYNAVLVGGNVATPKAVARMVEAGADAVKVGIGPGAACSTRIMTGVGVPQLTAVMECAVEADIQNVSLIADGGIRNPGDAAKALAAGADAVMVGSMFAGTYEAPGGIWKHNNKEYKVYRGMASSEAGSGYPEGVSGYVPYKGGAYKVLEQFKKGISSTCSYVGAGSITELQINANFIKVTTNTVSESRPHDIVEIDYLNSNIETTNKSGPLEKLSV